LALAKRGKAYYKRIGKLGLDKRYKSQSDTKIPQSLVEQTFGIWRFRLCPAIVCSGGDQVRG
jgi:hypothetical protein